jgi:hypothetical protein
MIAQKCADGRHDDQPDEVSLSARNAGVRIKITRLGNGMPAASISDDQKTTLKG